MVDEKTAERVAAAQKKMPRFPADANKILALQEVSSKNAVVREVLEHHSVYPFRRIGLTCKESVEARNFYLEILKSIGFSSLLKEVSKELLKIGEAVMIFEGSWIAPKFLSPESIVLVRVPEGSGGYEEHVEYRVDEEVREMVLNTPEKERANLLKLLDSYSIRQIELGRYIDLTRSPYVKVVHPRRMTAAEPDAPRGVSYFEPVLRHLDQSEGLKQSLLKGETQDYTGTIKKIRAIDKLVFDFAFPQDRKLLNAEFSYLQQIINHMLREEIFRPAAMARNFSNEKGLILPELQFETMDVESDSEEKNNVAEMRKNLGIDIDTMSVDEYLSKLKK